MEYFVQSLKVLRNLVHAETNAGSQIIYSTIYICGGMSENWILRHFPDSNWISLRDYRLIYACSDVCITIESSQANSHRSFLTIHAGIKCAALRFQSARIFT